MTIDIKKIDRSDWKPYKFDQIAESISERVEPQQTDLEIYVGLEHIDPETVHIKRWGSPKDVNGTKLKVYPGDVIFGKRRAYQRKAAIAEFEGICSAHAMVLRAKPDVIYPKLFPFFLHSDMFMHRAIDISVGSLSPTINWGTLKTQEFLLPPPEQQGKLAELLWAADGVVERYREMEEKLICINQLYQKSTFEDANLKHLKIGEIASVIRGKFSHRPRNEPKFYGGNIPFIQTSDVVNARYGRIETYEQTLNELGLSISKLFAKGTIVMTIAANIGDVAKLTFDSAFPDSLVGIIPNVEIVSTEYFFYLLKYHKHTFENHATKGAQMNLNNEILKNISIGIHDKKLQTQISMKLESQNTMKEHINNIRTAAQILQRQLINQVFG